jgi:N-acetylated-alpha-linked acidic dipeptidase
MLYPKPRSFCFRGFFLRPIIVLPLLASLLACPAQTQQVFGYHDFTQQAKWDAAFLPVPDAKLAGEHLKILTAKPHWASSREDYATAQYVERKFKEAGLETKIVPYRVLLNRPVEINIEAFRANGERLMSGPSPEHVDPQRYGGDPFQDQQDILPAFNGSSPSTDITANVVYANYGTQEDFRKLAGMGVSVKGKIVIVRYGANFRGVKVYLAQQRGARGVLIYSDPSDDGYFRGDVYPKGPYRPESGVQRGSVQFLPIYPGDPQTPGVASTSDLPDSKRIRGNGIQGNEPSIPANPLSSKDAAPILKALDGPVSPRGWQGALPFTYHVGGTGKVKVHMHLEQDARLRTIWNVIGTIPGTDPAQKDDWVIAGNHRDAWVFGAVDPSSGTAALLEAVHGLGELLKQGWRPRRTIIIASWDAEEQGLIGSTEWAEQNAPALANAVAYFNTDVGVSGPNFKAASVPSLKQFVREVTMRVPSPKGDTVYQQWKLEQKADAGPRASQHMQQDVHVGDLGSGSDYTPFLQHLGIPSTDIGSEGPYGVYHSTFDNYNWFIKFADPTFVYEQQQARIFGLEILHMANADVLPYDYQLYGHEIVGYLEGAQKHATAASMDLNFGPALAAAHRFETAGGAIRARQDAPPTNAATLNHALRSAESALLTPNGLPHRPWYKHTIYAPGEYTGYAAVVIPGVNEAIDAADSSRARSQLTELTDALNRASLILEDALK